jgi:hypothetical protein
MSLRTETLQQYLRSIGERWKHDDLVLDNDNHTIVVNPHTKKQGDPPVYYQELATDIIAVIEERIGTIEQIHNLLDEKAIDPAGLTWQDLLHPSIVELSIGVTRWKALILHRLVTKDEYWKKHFLAYCKQAHINKYKKEADKFTTDALREFARAVDKNERMKQQFTKAWLTLAESIPQPKLLHDLLTSNLWQEKPDQNDMHRLVSGIYFLFGQFDDLHPTEQPYHVRMLRSCFDHAIVPERKRMPDTRQSYQTNNGEYLILTDDELETLYQKKARENLWVFGPQFLSKLTKLPMAIFEALSEQYEDSNEAIEKLIETTCGFTELYNEARIDMGAIVSSYDGDIYTYGDWNIIRIN